MPAPTVFFQPYSNREDFITTVGIYDDDTGAAINLSGWTFEFEIRIPRPHFDSSGYIPWFDFGTPFETTPLITASLGSGITVLDTGILQILIPEATFRQLTAHTYMACLTGTNGTDTRQFFIGQLPVRYGGVTQ